MSLSPTIIGSMISGGCTVAATVTAVVLTAQLQSRRIDRENRDALREQTGEIKEHLKGDVP
jgi:hypothetical protein